MTRHQIEFVCTAQDFQRISAKAEEMEGYYNKCFNNPNGWDWINGKPFPGTGCITFSSKKAALMFKLRIDLKSL